MSDTATENLLTLNSAAVRLSMSAYTLRRYVRTGKLKAYIVGGRYRIMPADLEKLLSAAQTRKKIPAAVA